MKAFEWMAKDFARRWSKPSPDTMAQDALSHAWRQGFERMRLHASNLMEDLGKEDLAILINALGTAEVDPETGQRLDRLYL